MDFNFWFIIIIRIKFQKEYIESTIIFIKEIIKNKFK